MTPQKKFNPLCEAISTRNQNAFRFHAKGRGISGNFAHNSYLKYLVKTTRTFPQEIVHDMHRQWTTYNTTACHTIRVTTTVFITNQQFFTYNK